MPLTLVSWEVLFIIEITHVVSPLLIDFLDVNILLGFEVTHPVLNPKLLELAGVPSILLLRKGLC